MQTNQAADDKSSTSPLLKRLIVSLLRLFFRLLYHHLAFAYDWVADIVSAGKWQAWVLSVLPFVSGRRILEIGHGPGHLLAAFDQNEMLTIGLDESQQMGQLARRRLLRTKAQPNLVRGSAFTLPFADAAFDQVIMTFPAEFLLKPQTFAEIHRILVTGGRVIILPIAWITGRKPWERLAAWINRVTGEAPEWDGKVLEPLTAAGFTPRWEILEVASSKLLLIFLQKSAFSPAD